MKIEAWQTTDVTPYEGNPRVITKQAVDAVAESIRRYGFRQPIVVDEYGVVIAGHTRLRAAEQLGLDTVPVHVADLTEQDARAFRLADNRTAQYAKWEPLRLSEEFRRLGMDEARLAAATAFPPAQIQRILQENGTVAGQRRGHPGSGGLLLVREGTGRGLHVALREGVLMPRARVVTASDVPLTFRVASAASLFDLTFDGHSERTWDVDLPVEDLDDWRIGLIHGPSGSGKSVLVSHLFPDAYVGGSEQWPADKSVLDGFPEAASVAEITTALTHVGFSSPPSWLVPYGVLSVGERFRASLARLMLNPHPLVVMDEFTSTVNRQVARVGSRAVAKSIRRRSDKQFIAVTCHDDIVEWLQPDWRYDLGDPTRPFALASSTGRRHDRSNSTSTQRGLTRGTCLGTIIT